MTLLTFFALYNALYILCEIFFRKFGMKEFFRKCAHIGTGIITFISFQYLERIEYIFLFIGFIISFFLIRKFRIFRFLDEKGRGYGDIYFIMGQLICILFREYDIRIAQSWLLILTFADGLAPFGKYLWKKNIFTSKTLGGSIIFFVISSIILIGLYGPKLSLFIIAFLWTLSEWFGKKGSDNLIIPIIICLSLLIHERILPL